MNEPTSREARAFLRTLVDDFQERLRADEEWGMEGFPVATEMPRFNASALEKPEASLAPSPVTSPQAPSPASLRTPAEVLRESTASGRNLAGPIEPVRPASQPASPPPATAPYTPPPKPTLGNGPAFGEQGTPPRLHLQGRGAEGLAEVQATLGDCTRCPLHAGRKNLVFGEGAPTARLLFIGEGPGAQEDEQGRPFVGPAGQLLDKMIQAMGYTRESVYIANVVKCRPPNNRDPESVEQLQCRPFLVAQIEAIQPEVIVTLGKVATQALLETEERLSRLRGRWIAHPHTKLPVMPTYHPAALLRNPHLKRPVWEDLQKVMAKLGMP